MLDPEKAGKEMTRLSREQPDLLAYLMASTDDLDPEAGEVAVYLAFVIYRMFQASAARIKKVSSQEIIACHARNEKLLKNAEEAPVKFPDAIAGIPLAPQPHVMRYIVDALMEDAREAELEPLSDESKLQLFILLRTAVELLDKKAQVE